MPPTVDQAGGRSCDSPVDQRARYDPESYSRHLVHVSPAAMSLFAYAMRGVLPIRDSKPKASCPQSRPIHNSSRWSYFHGFESIPITRLREPDDQAQGTNNGGLCRGILRMCRALRLKCIRRSSRPMCTVAQTLSRRRLKTTPFDFWRAVTRRRIPRRQGRADLLQVRLILFPDEFWRP